MSIRVAAPSLQRLHATQTDKRSRCILAPVGLTASNPAEAVLRTDEWQIRVWQYVLCASTVTCMGTTQLPLHCSIACRPGCLDHTDKVLNGYTLSIQYIYKSMSGQNANVEELTLAHHEKHSHQASPDYPPPANIPQL